MLKIISYLKSNLWIILMVMILGNCYYFFKKTTENDYYKGILKFRTKSIVYDRLGSLLETFTGRLQRENTGSKLMYRSYRNEENYIFEVFIDSKDSNEVYKLGNEIVSLVKSDSIIRGHYYEKLDNISDLIKSQKEFLVLSDQIASEKIAEEVSYDVAFKKRATQINIFNLNNMKLGIYKDFEIYPFNSENVTFIHNNPIRELVKINIILMVLGVFAIVIIRQFKN